MKKEELKMLITLAGNGDDPLLALLRQLFAGNELCEQPGNQILQAAPGVLLQLCGAGAQPPAYLANAPQPVIAFKVDDLEQVVATAKTHGFVLLDHATDSCTASCFCYLRSPDGRVIGCFQ